MELLMLMQNPDCYDSLLSLLLWTKNCCFLLSPSVGAELQPRAKITLQEDSVASVSVNRSTPLLGSGSSVLDKPNKDFIFTRR